MKYKMGLVAPPTVNERKEAASISKELCTHLAEADSQHAWLLLANGAKIRLPPQLLQLIMLGLRTMGNGQGMRAVPVTRSLTTQQAADILGCSRQHVVNLIEQQQLKAKKIGSHRRVDFDELLAFMSAEDEQRQAVHQDIMESTLLMDGYGT